MPNICCTTARFKDAPSSDRTTESFVFACFGSRSILENLAEEPADRGHDRRRARTVDQVETVSDAGQFDVAHGGLGHRPQPVDERARLPDGDEAVVAPVYAEKGGANE